MTSPIFFDQLKITNKWININQTQYSIAEFQDEIYHSTFRATFGVFCKQLTSGSSSSVYMWADRVGRHHNWSKIFDHTGMYNFVDSQPVHWLLLQIYNQEMDTRDRNGY